MAYRGLWRITGSDVLRRTALRVPEKPAIIFKGKEITYREFNACANRVANALIDLGIKKGDRVSVLTLNVPEHLYALYGIWRAGAIYNPINAMLHGSEVRYIVNHAESKVFIVEDALLPRVKDYIGPDKMPSVEHYILIRTMGTSPPEGWRDFADLLSEKYPEEEPEVEMDIDDPCLLLYTSGTTGPPKGVLHCHRFVFGELVSGSVDLEFRPDDVVLLTIPIFHVAALYVQMMSVGAGATMVLQWRPDLKEAVELIEKYQVTYIPWPPTLLVGLWSFLGGPKRSFPSVKKIISFGNPFPMYHVLLDLGKIFPNARWMNYWGLTESGPLGASYGFVELNEETAKKLCADCIGKPHVTVELKLLDEEGREVPPGQIGELCLRGPSVMKEYFKDPEKTAETLKDGWLHTGDLGMINPEDGLLYFVDRKKDIIKSGGENVSSIKAETVIGTHPKVAMCAVVGAPHPSGWRAWWPSWCPSRARSSPRTR